MCCDLRKVYDLHLSISQLEGGRLVAGDDAGPKTDSDRSQVGQDVSVTNFRNFRQAFAGFGHRADHFQKEDAASKASSSRSSKECEK